MQMLWITNIATPYTIPLWREMAKLCNLQIACMAREEPNRTWTLDTSDLPITFLDCRPLRLNYETSVYLPSWTLLHLLSRRPQCVVVDGWESPAAMLAIIVARLLRLRVIVSYWSTLQSHRYKKGPVPWLRGLAFRSADAVYVPGRAARATLAHSPLRPRRVIQGFPVIDVSLFLKARGLRAGTSRPQGHRYLYVGQLIPRKNVDALIEAFSDISGKADTLNIVGNGPLAKSLQAQVDQLDLGDKVTFHGHLHGERLMEMYAQTDTLVLPSESEVWGLVVNEALVAGLTVVVSRHCGVAEDAADWPSVILTDTSPADLSRALAQVRTLPPPTDHPILLQTPQALARLLTSADMIGKD